MEFVCHGRPAAAVDDAPFPDPPPPPPNARVANASPRDALLRRREELLWELHKERIRQDMILRELAETEHAMTASFAHADHCSMPTLPPSRDYRNCRASSVTTWEDAPLHLPNRCPEHPPCCCERLAAARPPPVYPHVERSPSPVAMSGYLEHCQSPSKQTIAEEALVLAVTNVSVRPMGSVIVRQEVTPEHKDAAGGEPKADVEDGDRKQSMYESGNQSSGQRKAAETTMADRINEPIQQSFRYRPAGQENAAFNQQKWLEFSELAPEQLRPGSDAKQQECVSSRTMLHRTSGYLELCPSSSKQTLVEETLVPGMSDAGIRPTWSAGGQVAQGHRWDIGGKPKVDVENDQIMQPLYEIRNHSSDQRKALESDTEAQIDTPVHLSRQYMLASQGNAACNEQKRMEFSEPAPEQPQPSSDAKQQQECRSSGASVRQCQSPSMQTPVEETLVPAVANAVVRSTWSPSIGEEVAPGHGRSIGGEPNVDMEESPGVPPSYEIKDGSSGKQKKVVESAMEARINKPLRSPRQYKPAGQENAPYNERKRIVFSESPPERTFSGLSAGLKRRLTVATPPVKKPKPLREWSCAICHVNATSQRNLEEHLAGRLHQSKVEAMQARDKPPELSTKAIPWNKNLSNNIEPLHGKENVVENSESWQGDKPRGTDRVHQSALSRWTCSLCQAKCSTESDYFEHLNGRRHRENTEALHAEFRSDYDRRDAAVGKKTADRTRLYYCEVCDLLCSNEKMLASHLGGRKHREALEWRE